MTPENALRFTMFPTWHLARTKELHAMADAWHHAAGDRAPELDPALEAFRHTLSAPVFAKTQDALADHVERIFARLGEEEINDNTNIAPESLSALGALRRSKIGESRKYLENAYTTLPLGALKQEVEGALRIIRSSEWETPKNALDAALGKVRELLSATPAYQEAQAGLKQSFKAMKELHNYIFDGIDHGQLKDHRWLEQMREHHPALFDRVIDAANEDHIHIRRIGLNDPDIAEKVLGWRLDSEAMMNKRRLASVAPMRPAPTPADEMPKSGAASSAVAAEELAAPEIDAAKLARGCPAELPAAEAAMRDLKKLGFIAAVVGTAFAGAALLNRHARRKAEDRAPAWQARMRDSAASPSLSL